MSANYPSLYGQQFATQVELLLQQKMSVLRPAVTEGVYRGEQASPVDQVGAVAMSEVTSRFGPIVRTDAPVARRWVAPTPFDLAQQVDTFDKLKVLSDPMNVYTQNAVAAYNRKVDDVLIAAYYANAQTGKSGTGSTAFTSGNELAVGAGASGDVGMTSKKLRMILKLMYDNNVPADSQIFGILSPQAHDDLLAETVVSNKDYTDKPVLVDGVVKRHLGINFMISNRLPTSSGDRRIPIFVKGGLHLGVWENNIFSVDQRKDLEGHPWQIYNKAMIGATRLQENLCYSILCNE